MTEHQKSLSQAEIEKQLTINSRFYCPSCTGGGDLYVKNTQDYLDGKALDYYCKRCKKTFKIEDNVQ